MYEREIQDTDRLKKIQTSRFAKNIQELKEEKERPREEEKKV